MAVGIDFRNLFGSVLLKKNELGETKKVSLNAIKDKTVGILFSRDGEDFNATLKDVYHNLVKGGRMFEIVYVSSDTDADAFESGFQKMPWLAVPFESAELRNGIQKALGVQNTPALTMVSVVGDVLTSNAKAAVTRDKSGDQFPWENTEVMYDTEIWEWGFALMAWVLVWLLPSSL